MQPRFIPNSEKPFRNVIVRKSTACAKTRSVRIAAAVAAVLGVVSSANAAVLTWDADGIGAGTGGTGSWDTTSANWNNGAATWNNGTPDSATFGATAGVVTLAEPITAASLTLSAAGYTIDLAGNNLTVPGSSTGVGTITNLGATVATFTTGTLAAGSPTLAGNMNVVWTGASNWTPTIAHTFTGAFTFRPTGTASILATSNANFGSANGLIKLDATSAAAIINFSTPDNTQTHTYTRDVELIHSTGTGTTFAEFRVNGAKEVTLAGTISGGSTGTLGGLRFGGGPGGTGQGSIVLTGANTYVGQTTLSGQSHMLVLANNLALGTNAQGSSGVTLNSTLQTLGLRGGIDLANTNAISIQAASGQPASGFGHIHAMSGDNRLANNITWTNSTAKYIGAEAGSTLTIAGMLGSTGSGINKVGFGTLILSAANTFGQVNGSTMTYGQPHVNATAVLEGALRLDFSGANAPVADIINNNNAQNNNQASGLFLRGGTLELKGAAGLSNSQRFKNQNQQGTTFAPGASAIVLDKNGAANLQLTLNKVAIRYPGATVDFSLPAGAQTVGAGGNGITTTTLNTNGILGAFATVGGMNWASTGVTGTNVITPFSGYANDVWLPGENTTVTTNGVLAGHTTNSLRYDAPVASLITMSNTNTITSGGILVTPNVGANDAVIAGGTLTVAPVTYGGDLVVHQNNPAGKLTIASVIENEANPANRTATLNNGNGTVTGLSSTADLHTGMLVTGTNVGANARILSIDSATGITLTANSTAGGAADLTFVGNSGLTKTGSGTLILAEANTYTGETHLNGGVLRLQGNGALGGGKLFFHEGVLGLTGGSFTRALATTATDNTVQFLGSGGFAAYGTDVTVNLGGAGASLSMGGTNGFVPTGSAFVLSANDADATVIVQNPVFLRAPNQPQQREVRVLNGSADVDARFAAGFTGANQDGGLTKTGNGTLEVAGAAATYAGPTFIEAGEIRFGVTNALPNLTPITIRSGTLNLNGFNHSPSGGVTMGGGASGTTSAISTGTGTFTLASNFIYQGNIANDSGATISGNVSLGTLARTFLVNNSTAAATDVAVIGDISGTGGLRKTGAGTMQLLGNNSYTGATTIVEGVLGVSGTLSGSSAVSVEGGTLSGTGGVGVVTMTSGVIAPGAAIGALHTADVSLNGGALDIAILNATTADQLDVSGTVNFGAPVNLTLSVASALPASTSFTIINNNLFDPVSFASADALLVYNGNSLDEGEIFAVTGGFGSQAFQISYAGGTDTNDVVLTAVPEPSAAVMVLAGVGCLVGYQRRRALRR